MCLAFVYFKATVQFKKQDKVKVMFTFRFTFRFHFRFMLRFRFRLRFEQSVVVRNGVRKCRVNINRV